MPVAILPCVNLWRILRCWLLFLIVFLWAAPVIAVEHYPKPPWLDFTMVGERIVINGLPSEVYSFVGKTSMEDTLNFYRKKWHSHPDATPGYRESVIPGWHIIARPERGRLFTVQLRTEDPKVSEGFLAIARLDGIVRPRYDDIPMLPQSSVLNQSEGVDFGKKSRVVLLSNNTSVADNASFYQNYFTGRGWTNDVYRIDTMGTVMVFRNSGQEANLVIKRLFGATQVVLTLVDR